VLAGCHGGDENAAAATAAVVQTAVAAPADVPVEVSAPGVVVPHPGGAATLSAPVPARVAQVLVAVGDRVAAGAPLVAFELEPFTAANREAEAAADAARQAFARAERLAGEGIVPRRDVEQARVALAQAEAAALLAHRALERGTLRAPIAGVVSRVSATVGASADPSQSLVEIVDPTAPEITLFLAPGSVSGLRPGAAAEFVTADAVGTPARGRGTVVAVGAAVDSAGGGVLVRVRVASGGAVPRIGETVSVRIRVRIERGALAVPKAALVPIGDGYQLFVIIHDTAHATPVTLGFRGDALVQILTGLTAGDTVVTEGAYGLEDGVPVTRAAAKPGP
jgi:membrane fusion protein (multidrug efflux system)